MNDFLAQVSVLGCFLRCFNIAPRHCGSWSSGSILLGLVVIDKGLGVGIELAFTQFTLDKEDVGLSDADGGAFAAYFTSNATRRCSLSLQPRLNQREQILDAKGPRYLVLQLLHLGGLVVVLARPRRDDVVGHARAARHDEEERTVGLSGRGDVFVAAQVILAIDATVPTPHFAAHHDAIAAVDPLLDGDEALRVLDPLDGVVGLFEREKRLPDEGGHGSYDDDVGGEEAAVKADATAKAEAEMEAREARNWPRPARTMRRLERRGVDDAISCLRSDLQQITPRDEVVRRRTSRSWKRWGTRPHAVSGD